MKLQGTILKECGILLPLLVQFSTAIALNKAISPQPYNTWTTPLMLLLCPNLPILLCDKLKALDNT
jgi:hypothetical protein